MWFEMLKINTFYQENKQKMCFFLPDNTSVHQFDDFPLRYDSVGQV